MITEKQTFEDSSSTMFVSQIILEMLLEKANVFASENIDFTKTVHFRKIQDLVDKGQKIQIVLPAFPAKSPNSEKTCGKLPDMGEVLSLKGLNELCARISNVYGPGAEVIICSDGRVFSDLVEVSDEDVNRYTKEIADIIEKFSLTHLKTFNLEDVYTEQNFDEMREILVEKYARSIEEIREEVKSDLHTKNLFNGIHRFIFEDQSVLHKEQSKNSIRKNSKKIAYQVIQRSNAWSGLVEQFFSTAVRLSIHPHHISSGKLGIQMLPCKDRWGTPWHNVVLFDGESYSLVKHKDALAAGAIKTSEQGYSFFTLVK